MRLMHPFACTEAHKRSRHPWPIHALKKSLLLIAESAQVVEYTAAAGLDIADLGRKQEERAMRLTGMGSLDVGLAPLPFGYPAQGSEEAAQELMNMSRHQGPISAVRLPFISLLGHVHVWLAPLLSVSAV